MSGREGGALATEARYFVGDLVATMVVRRVVKVVWVAASGKAVPENPADPRVSTGEAVAFALLSGALGGAARILVQRKASQFKAGRVRKRAAAVA